MTRRKGVFSWEHEPAGERRTGFRTTVASDWQQSANSTFAEPSRLEGTRRRRARRRISPAIVGVLVAISLTMIPLALALHPARLRSAGG